MQEPQRKRPLAYSSWPHLKLRGPFRNKRQKKVLSQHPSGTARPTETKQDSWRPDSSAERTKLTLDSWAHSTQTTPRRYPFRCSQASPTDVQGELRAQHANDMGGTVQGQAHGTLERHGKASEAATLGCSPCLTSNQVTAQRSCAPSPFSLVGEGTPQSAPSLRVQGLNPTQVSLLFSLVAVRGARGRGRGDGNGGGDSFSQ